MNRLLSGMFLSLAVATANAAEAPEVDSPPLQSKLDQALQASDRPTEDRSADAIRMPQETLEFFGLREDMRVIDILPGGGYYTRLLAPIVAEKGKLYLTIGTGRLESGLLKEQPFKEVEILARQATIGKPEGERYYQLEKFDLQVAPVDMVTSFRAYHLFDEPTRAHLNREIHEALKPGGIYAVIDHTRRHAEPETQQNVRRFDPVKAILEIEAAGFDFVAYSPMHYQSADDLTLEVGDKQVAGRTDRWALKFVKR